MKYTLLGNLVEMAFMADRYTMKISKGEWWDTLYVNVPGTGSDPSVRFSFEVRVQSSTNHYVSLNGTGKVAFEDYIEVRESFWKKQRIAPSMLFEEYQKTLILERVEDFLASVNAGRDIDVYHDDASLYNKFKKSLLG